MEKISWTDRVRNEEVLHRVKGEGNNGQSVKHTAYCVDEIFMYRDNL
jgi:hypothetical protein